MKKFVVLGFSFMLAIACLMTISEMSWMMRGSVSRTSMTRGWTRTRLRTLAKRRAIAMKCFKKMEQVKEGEK